jgi:putative Mn2+ efflux pump MntP
MRGVMADQKPTKEQTAALLRAGVFEALCILAGVVAWLLTGSWVWIAAGVLAGLGFSVPAIIVFLREAKERNRASR